MTRDAGANAYAAKLAASPTATESKMSLLCVIVSGRLENLSLLFVCSIIVEFVICCCCTKACFLMLNVTLAALPQRLLQETPEGINGNGCFSRAKSTSSHDRHHFAASMQFKDQCFFFIFFLHQNVPGTMEVA